MRRERVRESENEKREKDFSCIPFKQIERDRERDK